MEVDGANPATDVRRPRDPMPRDRRISQDEIDRITLASGFAEVIVIQVKQRVGVAFPVASSLLVRWIEVEQRMRLVIALHAVVGGAV